MLDTMLEDMGAVPDVQQQVDPITPPIETTQVQQVVEPQVETTVLSINNDEPQTVQPTANNTSNQASEMDRGKILNELFGIDNPDTIKERLLGYDELKASSEAPKYQTKFAEYIDQLVSQYGDPKSQTEAFKSAFDVLTTDVATMDSKQAIAFQMKQEYPSLGSEEIDLLISSKYKLSEYASDDEQRLGQIQMKLDSEKAKTAIRELQINTLKDVPNKTNELKAIDTEKRNLEWKTKTNEVVAKINSFEFEVDKGKKVKFDIPQADKALLSEIASQVAPSFSPDANGMEQVQKIVEMTYVYNKMSNLISNSYKKGLSEANAEWEAKVNNPSGGKNTAPVGDFAKAKTADEQFVEFVANLR
jgi:hypothetical protein